MPVLSDKWIKKMALEGMISPFQENQVRMGKISYGLSSFGYDARVSDEFKIFTNINGSEIVEFGEKNEFRIKTQISGSAEEISNKL